MPLTDEDIIHFIKKWQIEHASDIKAGLNDQQIASFVSDLQDKISKMDYTLPDNATVIAYSGYSNGTEAWRIAQEVSQNAGNKAVYISDLPAGDLLNNLDFINTLRHIVKGNNMPKILSGCRKELDLDTGEETWIREGNSCGFGKDLLSLNDFVSDKLMRESTGISDNIIVFIPESVDPAKVFATTELEAIFKNNSFQYINGIPKAELETIYRSGDQGKESVYDIITQTAKQAVGDTKDISSQAQKLQQSFEENGILNSRSSDFSLSACYDANGKFAGVELKSLKSGTLIERPADNMMKQSNVKQKADNRQAKPTTFKARLKQAGERAAISNKKNNHTHKLSTPSLE